MPPSNIALTLVHGAHVMKRCPAFALAALEFLVRLERRETLMADIRHDRHLVLDDEFHDFHGRLLRYRRDEIVEDVAMNEPHFRDEGSQHRRVERFPVNRIQLQHWRARFTVGDQGCH